MAVPLQGTNEDEDKRPQVETWGYYAKRLQRFSTKRQAMIVANKMDVFNLK